MINITQKLEQLGIESEINEVIAPFRDIGGLYISNYAAAVNPKIVKDHNILAIITLMKGCSLPYTKIQMPNYLYIPVEDKPTANLGQYFEKCVQFIEKSRKKTNVLVHCKVGISRSSAIVIAYLMKKYSYTLKQAYTYLKRSHPRAKPNSGFIKALQQYDKQLYNSGQLSNKINNQHKQSQQFSTSRESCTTRRRTTQTMMKSLTQKNLQMSQRIENIKQLVSERMKKSRSKSAYLLDRLEQVRKKSRIKIGQEPLDNKISQRKQINNTEQIMNKKLLPKTNQLKI